MRRASVVYAKNHFSELVELAQHKNAKILICRHGKPAAALVPVHFIADETAPKRRRLSEAELAAFWEGFGEGDTDRCAVEELLKGRERLMPSTASAPRKRSRRRAGA
jgi:prevent-host-death family protein